MGVRVEAVLPANIYRRRERKANCFRADLQAAYREGFDEGYRGIEPVADYRGDLGLAYVCGGLDGCTASGTKITVDVPFGRGVVRRVA